MNEFLEALSLAVIVCLLLVLFFLFSGEPDVWDKLRERAMQVTECQKKEASP